MSRTHQTRREFVAATVGGGTSLLLVPLAVADDGIPSPVALAKKPVTVTGSAVDKGSYIRASLVVKVSANGFDFKKMIGPFNVTKGQKVTKKKELDIGGGNKAKFNANLDAKSKQDKEELVISVAVAVVTVVAAVITFGSGGTVLKWAQD